MEKEKTRSSWEKFKENRPALLLSSAVIIAFNLLCFGIDAYKKHKTEQERIRAPRERPEEYYPKECYRYKECLKSEKGNEMKCKDLDAKCRYKTTARLMELRFKLRALKLKKNHRIAKGFQRIK